MIARTFAHRLALVSTLACLAACTSSPDTEGGEARESTTPAESRSSSSEEVKGTVAGRPFRLDECTWQPKTGVLSLQKGEDSNSTEYISVSIFTFLDEEIPEDEAIVVKEGAGPGMRPHVHLFWSGGESGGLENDIVMDGYTLDLHLETFEEGRLSGSLHLRHPGSPALDLAGTFRAEVQGAWRYGHRPDLTRTDSDVFAYLAYEFLSQEEEGLQPNRFEVGRSLWREPGEDRSGWAVVHASWGPEEEQIETRLILESVDGRWRVKQRLEPHQVAYAHLPYEAESASWVMKTEAGRLLERCIREEGASERVDVYFSVDGGWNPRVGLGWTTIYWRRDGQDPLFYDRLLFREEGGEWRLVRSLGPREEVDFEAGRVLERKGPAYEPDLPTQLRFAGEEPKLRRRALAPGR